MDLKLGNYYGVVKASRTMTKDEFHKWISEYEFKKYANFVKSENGHAAFDDFQLECKEHGYVYLWAEEAENEFNIVYIGKAGKTMKDRCNQHLNGFKGRSKTGERHSKRIMNGIKEGKKYCVYARKSNTESVLGEQNISMCCVEELALIQKLDPEWNSIKS